MSEFSNAYGRNSEAASAYVAALMGLVGNRDPLTVLPELVGAIEELTAGLDAETLARPERPGKWSMAAVVAHLADAELVQSYRLRLVLAQSGVVITGYDQDGWAAEFDYDHIPVSDSLRRIAPWRDENLTLIAGIKGEKLERFGLHNERGKESVAHMIRLMAGHDLIHRRQLARIRAAVTA